MSVLLKEIKLKYPSAVYTLEREGFRSDSDIQSLTRQDLNELFPNVKQLKLRKDISEIIHKQKPLNVVLKQVKDFIPDVSLKAALTENGVLNDYLHILRDMKTQMNNVQMFLDAHIDLLEEIKNEKQKPSQDTRNSMMTPKMDQTGTSFTGTSPAVGSYTTQNDACIPEKQDTRNSMMPPKMDQTGTSFIGEEFYILPSPKENNGATVKIHSVISGQTFGTHRTLLDRVMAQGGLTVEETQDYLDCQIVIIFRPVSSRIGSDVEAAMSSVPGDKPVILVMMHHTHNIYYVAPWRKQSPQNVVLDVNVLYHEAVPGLLKCQKNTEAICEIHRELLKHSSCNSSSSSGNDVGGGFGSSGPGSSGGSGSGGPGSSGGFGSGGAGNNANFGSSGAYLDSGGSGSSGGSGRGVGSYIKSIFGSNYK